MKIALLGGGGFRVPMVFEALLARASGLGLDEVTLYDVSELRLAQITPVLEGLEQERGERLVFRPTTVLEEALDGADFVFCAIRPGQLEGRVVDERVPLDAGLVGQETIGPGGICMALRTVPVMVELARAVAQLAPRAWFVNFTNPAGLVTEAIQDVLGGRAVGICDTPSSLCRRVAAALDRPQEELWFDYFGLNHLGWLRGVRDGDRDLLPDLLADDERLESIEEGRLFGGEWLRSLGMIPNEYLYFVYFASDTVDALRDSGASRGELLLHQQAVFYAGNGHSPPEALEAWRAVRRERDRTYFAEARTAAGLPAHADGGEQASGYEAEAIAVVQAITGNEGRVLILDTANRRSLPFLDERAVVEVPCVVGRAGAIPTAIGAVPDHARALIETIKDVERTTIRAALEQSAELAIKALALHPLVPSVNVARSIFEQYATRHHDLAGRFGR
jgi:6-phospho-beta-glucosidase